MMSRDEVVLRHLRGEQSENNLSHPHLVADVQDDAAAARQSDTETGVEKLTPVMMTKRCSASQIPPHLDRGSRNWLKLSQAILGSHELYHTGDTACATRTRTAEEA